MSLTVLCLRVMMSTIKAGQTPVLAAAFQGYLDVVRFLVMEAQVDPHQPNKVCKGCKQHDLEPYFTLLVWMSFLVGIFICGIDFGSIHSYFWS